MQPHSNKLPLYQSLFKGREDVFALRWEKPGKSGYMPVYSYDPCMYRLHKQRGGTFKDYKDKTYLKLDVFSNHKTPRRQASDRYIPIIEGQYFKVYRGRF
ncbi:TOTE conflict system archaeo-eukaryotic primase domain-containing protein [Sinomicrobium sp. M5D2P9]